MTTIDLTKDGLGYSANAAWAGLAAINFLAAESKKWHCQRFSYIEFESLKHPLSNIPRGVIVLGDGPVLLSLQNELRERGVNCRTEAHDENYFYNRMIIYYAEELV